MANHEHITANETKHAGACHGGEHAHAEAHAFTAADIAKFQGDDYSAGRAVVLLMLGIFSTGVVIYSIVAYSVVS